MHSPSVNHGSDLLKTAVHRNMKRLVRTNVQKASIHALNISLRAGLARGLRNKELCVKMQEEGICTESSTIAVY